MDAGKRTISDVFNGNRKLIIPFFQRSYVWGEEQWSRFIEDMEYISSSGKEYFLGSIILKATPTPSNSTIGDSRTIIDGQQRLTTMSIFMKVLGLKSHKESIVERTFTLVDGSLALQHSQGDSECYERIMDLSTLEIIEDSKSNIIKAYNYFRANIDEQKLNLQSILNKAQFVGIDLLPDEDEQQIFDTINSLGVRLTTGELLKNFFFSKENINEYELLWKPTFEDDDDCREFWDQDVTTGRLKRNNIEVFLAAYLQIKIQSPSLSVKSEDKVLYRRAEGLFGNYKRFISTYVAPLSMPLEERRQKITGLIKDLVSYARIFKENFSASVLSSGINSTPSVERLNVIIYGLDGTTLIPYLLYVLKEVDDESEKKSIFSFLESYLMRRLICKSSNNNYSDLFTENLIGNDIRTEEALCAYIRDKDDSAKLAMPSDYLVRKAFNEYVLPNKRAQGVLYLLESKIRPEDYHSTGLLGFEKYSVEHLMPKKWRNNWGVADDPDYRDAKLLTLGNLTIITTALNSSIRDAEWSIKLEGKGNKRGLKAYSSGLEIMNTVLDSFVWDEDSISERAYWLAEKSIQIWPSYLSDDLLSAKENELSDESVSFDLNPEEKIDYVPAMSYEDTIAQPNQQPTHLFTGYYPKSKPTKLCIIRKDDSILCEIRSKDTFVMAIREAGVEKVAQLELQCYNTPLILDHDDKLYGRSRAMVAPGYYVITNTNNETKKEQLDKISNALGLGWFVDIEDE